MLKNANNNNIHNDNDSDNKNDSLTERDSKNFQYDKTQTLCRKDYPYTRAL